LSCDAPPVLREIVVPSDRPPPPTAPASSPDAPLVAAERDRTEIDRSDEPPVVARLVIEIRSDGKRTIARGAAEDAVLGEKVAVQAEGTTPMALALSLAKSLFDVPVLARTAFKAMLAGRKKKRDDD